MSELRERARKARERKLKERADRAGVRKNPIEDTQWFLAGSSTYSDSNIILSANTARYTNMGVDLAYQTVQYAYPPQEIVTTEITGNPDGSAIETKMIRGKTESIRYYSPQEAYRKFGIVPAFNKAVCPCGDPRCTWGQPMEMSLNARY